MEKALIVIPARRDSGRLPDKVLLERNGKTLLQITWEQAMLNKNICDVVVLVDDPDVADVAKQLGMIYIYDEKAYENGTRRAAALLGPTEAYMRRPVIVWQVDEPGIRRDTIQIILGVIQRSGIRSVTTITSPLDDTDQSNPNVVKAVCHGSRVAWFSRDVTPLARAHVGIYAFSSGAAFYRTASLEPTPYATKVRLEQITWLMEGHTIYNWPISYSPLSINTPADWTRFCS